MNWSEVQSYDARLHRHFARLLDSEMLDSDDRGTFMEILRTFKNKEEERLERSEVDGAISLQELLISLTALAEVCLEAAYRFESRTVEERYGIVSTDFHIIGMGKFGGYEITLHSDLDLIFIYDKRGMSKGKQEITHQEYFVRLVQRLISNLSLRTRRGRVYEIDTELRPSGRAGVLVSSWPAFAEYHHKDARTWEKQSLLRGRPVAAHEESIEELSSRLLELIWCRQYGEEIVQEMHHLRMRMQHELAKENEKQYNVKVGEGGIVDIEFIVQYLQLRFGKEHESIVVPHTLCALDMLAEHECLAPEDAHLLKTAYLFYRKIETRLRSLAERSADILPRRRNETSESLMRSMNERSWGGLLETYETYRRQVRQLYLKILRPPE